MTRSFSSLMEESSNIAYTENGALSNQSSLDLVLDLFAMGGSVRKRSKAERYDMISFALAQNLELGLRALLYLGDVREGQGERDLFKIGLRVLSDQYPLIAKSIIRFIPEYGRWDYIYEFVGTPFEKEVIRVMQAEIDRLSHDESATTSLIFKWLKSPNTSSKESCRLGRWTAKALGFGDNIKGLRDYQQFLKLGRASLEEACVETKLTDRKFNEIDYSRVCSKANLKYKKAFARNDKERYDDFHAKVAKGEVKVNTSVLYPHDIVSKYIDDFDSKVLIDLENFWKALPKLIPSNENIMPIIDRSGSMHQVVSPNSKVTAAEVAMGVGLYTAENIEGAFKDKAILFSSRAQFLDFSKFDTLYARIKYLLRFDDYTNTNLQSVFTLILQTALDNAIPQSEMPTKLLIISDMEFDPTSNGATNLKKIQDRYEASGYAMPQIVFWNVMSRNNQLPATKYNNGVAMISGFSPSMLKDVFAGEIINPINTMLKVLNKPRYDVVNDLLHSDYKVVSF